jgi:hypothetical protein
MWRSEVAMAASEELDMAQEVLQREAVMRADPP